MTDHDDSIRTTTTDVPMAPDSTTLRARLMTAHAPTEGSGEDPYEKSTAWGGHAPEAVFDNENGDDPRHEMEWEQLLAHPPTLKVIRYQNVDLDERDLEALIAAPVFAGIECLDLRRNFRSPDDALMARLIASGRLANLRILSLENCYQIGDATLRAIGAGAMPKLECLEIGSTEVTNEGLMALADAERTPVLRLVQGMFLSEMTPEGPGALAAARPGLGLSLTMD